MNIIRTSPLWLGFDTQVSVNVVFAMHTAYQSLGMSKSDLRHIISCQFCLTEAEDLSWAMLKVLEDGNYLETYTKGGLSLPKKPFTPLEMKIIDRFMSTYSRDNLNPLQLFVENYMQEVILVNHFNSQLVTTTLDKHFEKEM